MTITRDSILALGGLVNHREIVRLIHVERYGKLLALAIDRAWSHGVPIVRASFGLDYMSDGTRIADGNGCCIVGAAAVGTHARYPIFEAVGRLADLSSHELDGILTGFEASTMFELTALQASRDLHHVGVAFGASVADALGLPPRRNDTYVDARHRPTLHGINEF